MKGYRKIGECSVTGCPDGCEEENGYMDDQIRGTIHSSMIGEMQKTGCKEFYIVVYKRVKP